MVRCYQKEAKSFLGSRCLGNKKNNMAFTIKNMAFWKSKNGPVETNNNKGGNVSAYIKKNQQYVDGEPLSPGYEDSKKIQKVQREGLIPGSQKFDKKINS